MRSSTKNREPTVDTGEVPLFYSWDSNTGAIEVQPVVEKQSLSSRLAEKKLAALALKQEKYNAYPKSVTIDDILSRFDTSQGSDERDDAYTDLGGGWGSYRAQERLGRAEGFAPVMDAYKDWHEETYEVAVNLRLTEISESSMDEMTAADRRLFSLHTYRHLEYAESTMRQIIASGGEVAEGTYLHRHFGSDRSASELMDYAKTLGQLLKAVENTGVTEKVKNELGVPQRNQRNYIHKRSQLLGKADADCKKNGDIRVNYESGKFRVER